MTTRSLRRWHIGLSVVVGLFIVFQGITGSIAQQRFRLMALIEPGMYQVDPAAGDPLSPQAVLDAVIAQKPDFRPAHVMYPADDSPQTAVIVMGGRNPARLDMSRTVMVDQYGGDVIAERASSDGWVGTVTGLHKWTTTRDVGRIVLILFGVLVAVFMTLSIVLSWRTRSYAKRFSRLKRWHRRLGIGAAVILIGASLSGISLKIYTWIEKSGTCSVVSQNMRAAMKTGGPTEIVVGLDDAYGAAIEAIGARRLAAFSKAGPHAAQHWFAFTDDKLKRTDVLVNAENGAISLHPAGLAEKPSLLREWLYPIHSGRILGPWGGLLMTVFGAALVFWPISGSVMWLHSRL